MGIAFAIFWVVVGLGYAGVKIGKEARDSSKSTAMAGLGLFAVMMAGYFVIAIVGLAIAEVMNETVRNVLFVVYGIAVVAVMAYFIIKPEIDMCRIANINPVTVRTSHPEIWEEVLNMPLPSDKVLKEWEPENSKKFNRSPEELRRLAILRWREFKLEQIYRERYVKNIM